MILLDELQLEYLITALKIMLIGAKTNFIYFTLFLPGYDLNPFTLTLTLISFEEMEILSY